MANLQKKLNKYLGKSIDQICPNKFHDFQKNHCAHFVSHAVGLEFSYQCREYKGGKSAPANIRVHEVFSQCPRVGKFEDAPGDRPVLVFVTRKKAVTLSTKTMLNIPQKHIGIHIDGFIYHYSNSQEKVVKWKVAKFFDTFQSIYSGDQGLFYGTFPASDLNLTIDKSGKSVHSGIGFELSRVDKKWFAKPVNIVDSKKFYVAREVRQPAKKYFGIFQRTKEYYGPKFEAKDYVDQIDHWAYLLHITGYCESKNYFNLINTYDRAKFTFGFYQLAAHTPNDNLILLFRQALKLSAAREYFPELALIDGKVHRVDPDGDYTNLETIMPTGKNKSKQLQLFMNYLNPKRYSIEQQEVLQTARLMHWMTSDLSFRAQYIQVSNDILQHKMSRRYHSWYNLDGQSDIICALIADIHHQGRAKKKAVRKALASNNPRKRLLQINPKYANRNKSLKKVIEQLEAAGKIGHKVYDAANNEFR